MNYGPKIIEHIFPGQRRAFHFSVSGKPIMYHVGISGGKDSDALLIWLIKESGIPVEQINVTFSDTKNEDGRTYAQVRMLSERLAPVTWLEPDLGFFDLALSKKRFPARRARFCTQYLKMVPAHRHINSLLEQGYEVIALSGVRADESDDRAKLSEWANPFETYFGTWEWRPLLRWKIEDVWLIHKRYGIPRNALYDAGMTRVGCFPCINSNKKEIRVIAKKFPERIVTLREWEDRISEQVGHRVSFFHYKTVTAPFRSIPYTAKDGRALKICTIDDVVAWSKTSDGRGRGRQFSLDYEETLESADTGVCPSQYGACE